jgi:hypothetical protein
MKDSCERGLEPRSSWFSICHVRMRSAGDQV